MGTSTNGQICYGIAFEEGYEFPWNTTHGDINDWWLSVCGYKPTEELYDSDGNYLDGQEPPREQIERYFDERRAFAEAHPMPVELVNYCSGECAMYVLAVPSSVIIARRGYPEEFDPAQLNVTLLDVDALLQFCKAHNIETSDPKWFLTSYWG